MNFFSFLLRRIFGQSKNPLEVSWFITGKIVLVQKYNNYSTMFKNNNFVLTHRGFQQQTASKWEV